MIRALYTAASGMNAQQTNIDNTAHNLANVNTAGFKKARVEFEDLVYQQVRGAGAPNSTSTETPIGLEIGLGTRAVGTARDFASGNLKTTNGPLDVAVQGQGFFQVTLPDGRTAYTRAGAFHMNAEGGIVTAEGYPIEPAITIPADATSISISKEGVVSVTVAGQNAAQQLGTIELATFQNPPGLAPLGGNFFEVTTASGEADHRRARHGRPRHHPAGLPRGVERQHRRGDDQHDPRAARLRGELAGGADGRRDAPAGQQPGALIVMLAALVLAAAASSADAAPIAALAATEADVRAAIVRAVEERVALPHAAVEVTVEDVRIRGGVAGAGLRATPDAGSRAGGPMRFILHAAGAGAPESRVGARVGSADAIVRLRTRYARATRTLGPGTIVGAGRRRRGGRQSRARAAAAAAAGRRARRRPAAPDHRRGRRRSPAMPSPPRRWSAAATRWRR